MLKSKSKEYHTRQWRRVRLKILERASYVCNVCGKLGASEVDHVIPLQDGGDFWSEGNLQSICSPCHIEKTRKENEKKQDPKELFWEREIQEILNQGG